MADVIHKSAHPSLPPAAPQQVVQYLLAKNFHLTALELLVEAQQAGHGDDVRDLEAFFSDPDRFPPEELARHQPYNALNLQAAGKERESRLQLAEYELRLAKEDLAEMARKLAQAQGQQQQQQTHVGSSGSAGSPAGSSPFSQDAAPSLWATATSPGPGTGRGLVITAAAAVGSGGAAPTPSEQRALNTAVFTHLLRQGLVTTAMTMEEEYGRPLRPMGHSGSSSPGPATHGPAAADSDPSWELWSWYQAAAAAAATQRAASTAANTSTVAAAPGIAAAAATASGQVGDVASLGSGGQMTVAAPTMDPDDVIRQFDLGPDLDLNLDHRGTTHSSSESAGTTSGMDRSDDGGGVGGSTIALTRDNEGEGEVQLRALREEMVATRARARAAVVAAMGVATAAAAAAALQRQEQQQRQHMKSAPPLPSIQSPAQKPLSYISSDAAVLDLLDLGSSAGTTSGPQMAAPVAAVSPTPPRATPAGNALGTAAVSTAANGRAECKDFRFESDIGRKAAAAAAVAAAPLEPAGPAAAEVKDEQTEEARLAPAGPEVASHGSEAGTEAATQMMPPWLRRRQEIDPAYHASLEGLVSGLCDMLPRLVPNLNLKSRLEVLPLLVSTAKTSPEWAVRQQLLVAVFNLVPAPDLQQRQAIIEACLELCQAFGAGWAASELVQLCCRQASSTSCERRTLVAEALGSAVGAVDPGTQAHVLLTQLSQLAKDRTERVREAACHSLARLVPRLPFTRSYYSTLEGLLLPLATDGSEAVHVAALSYLVPALLTWQPQDTEPALVSSCLARVISEISQQVRIIEQYQQHYFHQNMRPHEQQQQQLQKGTAGTAPSAPVAAAAAPVAVTAGSFTGSLLRYSLATPSGTAPPSPSPATAISQQHPQQSPEGQEGGGTAATAAAKGSNSNLSDLVAAAAAAGASRPGVSTTPPPPSAPLPLQPAAPSTPPPPPPPAQWVTFGRRHFPSSSHLLLYQLLALYGSLAPALRNAALHTRPAWACPAGSGSDSGGSKSGSSGVSATGEPQASIAAAGLQRPLRAGSFDAAAAAVPPAAPVAPVDPTAGSAAAVASREVSALLPPSVHRRTNSQPAVGWGLGPAAAAAAALPATAGQPPSLLSLRNSDIALPPPSPPQTFMPKSSSSSGLANGVKAHGAVTAAAVAAGIRSGEVATEPQEPAGGEQQPQWGKAAEEEGERAEGAAEGATAFGRERAEEDLSLASWTTHGSHSSWRTLEWLVQHVVPELIRLVCCVGPMFPEALDVRRQAACAVATTCSVLGGPFTQAVMEPVFLVAAGTGAHLAPWARSTGGGGGSGGAISAGVITPDFDAPLAVRDVCAAVQPRTPEALRMARQCVLPVLLVSVLPCARQLRPHLLQLMGSAHELRQRWLLEALPDYVAALTFACSQRQDLMPQVLSVLEELLSGSGESQAAVQHNPAVGVAVAAAQPPPSPATGGGCGAPASTHVGLCCAAIARALVPLASLELASRRLLPGLMALMSYGEPELQRACVGVLAELGLRFRDQGPRVSEQVMAVYDSLLEQGGHTVQMEVLAAGAALAAAAAPSAAVAAAAAAQVEWMLTAVQVVGARLAAPAAGGNGGGGAATGTPSLEQQRALAAQLLAALRAVAPYDLRLPRLQANLSAALDALQRCKSLLPDPQQQAALAALMKERPTGQSAAGSSVSSSTPSSGTSAGTATAASATPNRMPTTLLPPFSSYSSPSAGALGPASAVSGLLHNPSTHAMASGASGLMHPFMLPPTGAAQVTHGSAQGTVDGGGGGPGGQLRSRFDAFRQRLMKRRDDAPAATAAAPLGAAPLGTTAAAGGVWATTGGAKPKESFFSDDEGE